MAQQQQAAIQQTVLTARNARKKELFVFIHTGWYVSTELVLAVKLRPFTYRTTSFL